MEKERIIELLARQMAGEITERERIELDKLITDYPDTVYYEEFLNQLWKEKSPRTGLEDAYERHINKHIDEFDFKQEEKVFLQKEKVYNNILLGLSVVCVIFIGIGGYLTSKSLFGDKSEVNNVQVVAGKGVRKKLRLPDGTQAWLNADTKLIYDLNMNNSAERSVTVSGEAFFDVTDSLTSPFIVHTNQLSGVSVDAQFNVNAYPESTNSVITLIKGSMELSLNSNSTQRFILQPSEKFILTENNKSANKRNGSRREAFTMKINHIRPVTIANQTYVRETAWMQNAFIFQNERFDHLRPKLERWFNVSLTVENRSVDSYRFTGIIKDENLTETLAALQLSHNFNFSITGNNVVIY